MAGITSAGIGSGLDINSLITQMMTLERQPLNALNTKKSEANQKISAFGQIKSAVSSLQGTLSALKSSSAFNIFKASTSDSKVASATADSSAGTGTYDLVIGQLAKSRVEGTSSGLFSQSESAIGVSGNLSFSADGKTFSIDIDAGDTLEDVRDAINNKVYDDGDSSTTDTTQGLLQASVINVGTSTSPDYRLTFTSKGQGSDGAVTIGGSAASALGLGDYTTSSATDSSSAAGTSLLQRESDAQLTINGVSITRSSNTIDDVVAGTTIKLTTTGSTTLTVGRDTEAITSKVNDFVNAYNKLQSTVGDLRKKGGTLEADSSALSVISNLQSVYNTSANIAGNSYKWLAEVGVSFKSDGTLSLDSSKFATALQNGFNSVSSLFTDETSGFATRLYDTASSMLNSDGLITSRTNGLNATIKSLDTRIDQMDARLTRTEARLRAQFSSLDSLLGTMKNTSNYLSRL